MSWRETERLVTERITLLEMEATLQRVELAATFEKWERRRALAWGSTVARWGFKALAIPKLRWLIATNILSRLKRRRAR